MQVDDHTWDLVNSRSMTRGCVATAAGDGTPDVAVIGSLQLSDRETMTMMVSACCTLSNLRENPRAAFIVTTGDTLEDFDGCRIHLEVRQIIDEGPVLDKALSVLAATAGEEAAARMRAFVIFDVQRVRPLMDPPGE